MTSGLGQTGAGYEDEVFGAIPGIGNEVSGVVLGPSVQARDISGGVHFYSRDVRLPPPSQLPPQGQLTGRAGDLAALDAARADGVVVVSGPPGIGKTALVVHWGHHHRAEFPDGVLYADLHGYAPDGPAVPSEVLSRFLRAFGVPPQQIPADLDERTALYRSITAGKSVLVVLDDGLSVAQVIPLLPTSASSLAMITSRVRLVGLMARGARIVQLDRLEENGSLELLTRTMGGDRARAEPDAARELAQLCAHLPLALCVAGARLAARPRWPISEMVQALRQEHRRLAALTMEDDMVVSSALSLSYRSLGMNEARMYRLMGLYPGAAFDRGVAAATAAVSGQEAVRLLGILANANLLDDAPGGRYRFHDLTRLHAREMADRHEPPPARSSAVRRMLDWYLATATTAGETAAPYRHEQPRDIRYPPLEPARFSGPDAALDWLDDELPNVMAAIRLAADEGLFALAWQLTDATWPVFLLRGHHAERLEVDRAGLDAARACGDPVAEAKMLNRIGLALAQRGRLDSAVAHFLQALSIWQGLGDDDRIAGSLRRLGFVAVRRRQFDQAIEYFSQALGIYRQLGATRKAALSISDIGSVLAEAGRAAEAVTKLQEARALLADVPDPFSQARILTRLGRAYAAADEPGPAVNYLRRALRAMREVRSPPGEAEALIALGDVAERTGRPDEARSSYADALTILTRLGAPNAERIHARLERLVDPGQR